MYRRRVVDHSQYIKNKFFLLKLLFPNKPIDFCKVLVRSWANEYSMFLTPRYREGRGK